MTIYVDPPQEHPTRLRHKVWSHMVSDEGPEELHAMAKRIGLKRSWSQEPPKSSQHHYDVTPSYREKAVAAGAKEVTTRELVARSYDGLQRRRQLAKAIADAAMRTDPADVVRLIGAISKDRELKKALPSLAEVSLLFQGLLTTAHPNLTETLKRMLQI